jgi:alpha-1,2-rhamnosyltransferase
LFVECTHTHASDLATGIQRVVRNVLRQADEVASALGFEMVPVVWDGRRLVRVELARVLADKSRGGAGGVTHGGIKEGFKNFFRRGVTPALAAIARVIPIPSVQRFLTAPHYEIGVLWLAWLPWVGVRALQRRWRDLQARWAIAFGSTHLPEDEEGFADLDQFRSHEGNVLLLLDCSWEVPVWHGVTRFREKHGRVVGVLYDLIPVLHPETCVPVHRRAFGRWLGKLLVACDAIVGISQTVARDLRAMVAGPGRYHQAQSRLAIGYFHLGSELDHAQAGAPVRPAIESIFGSREHIFLTVGSIEPRKNHPFMLAAFESYWRQGGTGAWVVIGKYGWMNDEFFNRVETHAQRGTRLFLLRDVGDGELDYAYRNASALLIASRVEGFGLPIVEAFQRGLPVICSDIPVFREIADGRASFFALDSPESLALALRAYCAARDPLQRARRAPQEWITWRQSTEQLLRQALAPDPRERAVLPAASADLRLPSV